MSSGPTLSPVPSVSSAEDLTVAPIVGLDADNGQDAFAELQGDVTALQGDVSAAEAAIDALEAALATTADMSIYVDAAGNDLTGDGSIGAPYATIQKAIDAIPRAVKHKVTVNVGAGNFAGFTVQGFQMVGAVQNAEAGLHLLGTFANATLSTGTATGTTTGGTNAVTNPLAFSIYADTGQSWTVNELAGKLLYLTATGTFLPIVSNTATTITVSSVANPGSGVAYRIVDCASVITSAIRAPAPIKAYGATSTPTGSLGCAHFLNNKATVQTNSIRIEGFKFASATASTAAAVNVQGTDVFSIARCQFTSGSATHTNLMNMVGPAALTMAGCVFKIATNNCSPLILGSNVFSLITNTVFDGTGFSGGFSLLSTVSLSQFIRIGLSGCYFKGSSFGVHPSTANHVNVSATQCLFDGQGNQGIRLRWPQTNYGASALQMFNTRIDNCGSHAVELDGPHFGRVSDSSGTGNVSGIHLSNGARMIINGAGVTLTGTTELTMDGNTTGTLAIMRAQTPKLLSTSFGTTLAEIA